MTNLAKLATLLDDPEVRVVVYGLAHVQPVSPAIAPGAPQIRAVVLRLADTTEADQYNSWLSDSAPNKPITVDQIRSAFGTEAINDLAEYAQSDPVAIESQLVDVLPDLVDAISPGGRVVDADELNQEYSRAIEEDDRSDPY